MRGVQRHAMACVKHFAANSMENSRFEVDVTVDEVALHEVFLPQFRRIVQEGVAVVIERVQLAQRRVVWPERHIADRGATRRVGIRRLRDQ